MYKELHANIHRNASHPTITFSHFITLPLLYWMVMVICEKNTCFGWSLSPWTLAWDFLLLRTNECINLLPTIIFANYQTGRWVLLLHSMEGFRCLAIFSKLLDLFHTCNWCMVREVYSEVAAESFSFLYIAYTTNSICSVGDVCNGISLYPQKGRKPAVFSRTSISTHE